MNESHLQFHRCCALLWISMSFSINSFYIHSSKYQPNPPLFPPSLSAVTWATMPAWTVRCAPTSRLSITLRLPSTVVWRPLRTLRRTWRPTQTSKGSWRPTTTSSALRYASTSSLTWVIWSVGVIIIAYDMTLVKLSNWICSNVNYFHAPINIPTADSQCGEKNDTQTFLGNWV